MTSLDWSDPLDTVGWHELSERHRLAPLGIHQAPAFERGDLRDD